MGMDECSLDARIESQVRLLHRTMPADVVVLNSPEYFQAFWLRGERWGVSRKELALYAKDVWVRWGEACLDRDAWREVFTLAGYRENDEPVARPVAPLTLWRGATPEFRTNWSWTEERDRALCYASSYWVQPEVGLVWRATVVEPGRLLAKYDYEFVVDTDGLLIEPDGLWCRCPVDLAVFRGGDRDSQIALDLHELVDCPRGNR